MGVLLLSTIHFSTDFKISILARSNLWAMPTIRVSVNLLSKQASHIYISHLCWSMVNLPLCCQLKHAKTINHMSAEWKCSRSFSVIFDTLWLIRSFSTGNCSWRPLINAPVPGADVVSVLNPPKVEAEPQVPLPPDAPIMASFQPKTYAVCLRIWNFTGLGNIESKWPTRRKRPKTTNQKFTTNAEWFGFQNATPRFW